MPSSIHSFGTRSMTSIATTTRSRKSGTIAGSTRTLSKKPKWWQKRPLLKDAVFMDIQKGSYIAAIYSLVESILMVIISLFDLYCLLVAQPGTRHFRSFGISFLFVYAGNPHIRRTLIAISVLLFASAVYLLVSSLILMSALRKEHEKKFIHWIRAMGVFIVWRAVTIIFQSVVNDLYFAYHQAMLVIWFLATGVNVFCWLVVVSNYQDLSQITRLEDMAKLKMSTLSSLNASRSLSHHSLDSAYKNYVISSGPVNLQPSPYASIGHNFGLRGSTSSVSNSVQPSPRLGASQNAIQLACLNPSGFNFITPPSVSSAVNNTATSAMTSIQRPGGSGSNAPLGGPSTSYGYTQSHVSSSLHHPHHAHHQPSTSSINNPPNRSHISLSQSHASTLSGARGSTPSTVPI